MSEAGVNGSGPGSVSGSAAGSMLAAIKVKAAIYVGLVHVGLVLALVGVFISEPTPAAWTLTLVGVAMLYGSFLFAALSIWLPLRPWIARYQYLRSWQSWVLREIPTLLALAPVALQAFGLLKRAWGQVKTQQEKGELSVTNLSLVAGEFAREAGKLADEPGVKAAKERLL